MLLPVKYQVSYLGMKDICLICSHTASIMLIIDWPLIGHDLPESQQDLIAHTETNTVTGFNEAQKDAGKH